MALLPDADRERIWRGLMRYWSRLKEPIAVITKTELKAAVDATDQWIDDNQAAFNAALPVPARTNLTTAQKTLLFCAVAAFRVSKDFAKRLIGEVD